MKTALKKKSSVPAAPTTCVALHLDAPGATTVCVAGSFNDWHPSATPMVDLGGGRWGKEIVLRPGRHEYLFVVDGEWMADPSALETVPNPFGGSNCVLLIPEPPDFPPAAPRKRATAPRKRAATVAK